METFNRGTDKHDEPTHQTAGRGQRANNNQEHNLKTEQKKNNNDDSSRATPRDNVRLGVSMRAHRCRRALLLLRAGIPLPQLQLVLLMMVVQHLLLLLMVMLVLRMRRRQQAAAAAAAALLRAAKR